jgi:hypothetical protein
VQQYIASRDEEVASQLEFGDSAGPADVEPAPVEPTAAAPAPAEEPVPAPVAESKQSLVNAIQKAKKAGATMETMIGNKTIAELIEECGMEPADVGFGQAEPGIDGMLKYVSGFYNKDQGNFPLGGMRVKIKVKKAFEDGEFGNVDESDLIKVLKFIDHKDPSGNVDQQMEAPQVQDECGTMPSFDVSTLETQIQSVSESSGYDEIKRLVSLVHYR